MTFVNENLYTAVNRVAEELSLEDPAWLFSFYYSHLKPHLTKLVEGVKSLKTGGKDSLHISRFTPFNKYLVIDVDYIDIAEGVRSEKQLKFYKMVIYKIIENANKEMEECSFKGKICMKKGFYSKLEEYWKSFVLPEVARSKNEKEEEEEEGEIVGEVEMGENGEIISTASQHGGEREEEDQMVSLAQEMPLTP
jgi:hypothetical protein